LAQRLGPDQPFYGLQAVGLDGESEPHTRIEDMAAHYIKVVQSVQPRGPYVLGGHSFGSIVAFEMAQQLQRQDEQVAMVVILEGVPKLESNPTLLAWDDAQWLTHMAHLAEDMMGKKLGVSCEILQSLEPDEQLRHLGERLQAGGWLPPGEVELAPLRGMVHVLKADSNMQYIPQDVHLTRVVLFRSSEPLPDESVGSVFPEMLDDPILGWGEFAKGKVKVYKIPGGHLTMLREPCVRVLAEHLGACLEKVQGEDA